jgi:hypothetical protein
LASIGAGLRAKSVALPAVAILLNITWEYNIFTGCGLLDLPFLPSGLAFQYCGGGLSGLMAGLIATTLLLDLVLLLQLALWGWAGGGAALGRARLQSLGLLLLGLCGAAGVHVALMLSFDDYRGVLDAWLINLVMSALFLDLLRQRPGGAGLSRLAAWTKLIGSACNAIYVGWGPEVLDQPLGRMFSLVAAVFVLDALYAVGLTRARAGARQNQ